MPVYIVSEGRILAFPDATVAKMAAHGNVIHIIRNDVIIGNFPADRVRYYGIELPPAFEKDFENQKAWEQLTPEQRAKVKAETQAVRKGGQVDPPPAEQPHK